jgi:hypothetical protein
MWKDNKILPVKKPNTHTDQDLNMVNTLFAVIMHRPTFLGKLAVRAYRNLRPEVVGTNEDQVINGLRYYHHPQFLGNPEVGETQVAMWNFAKKESGAK